MNSILYMLRKTLKNEIIDTIRHPLKFLLYLFIILSMIYGAVTGFVSSAETGSESLDPRVLSGAYMAVLYFVSIPIMLKGLSAGANFFALSDVNNLFVAPISNKKILIYGVGRELATMLILVICFGSYSGMIINLFQISLSQALCLIAGIAVMLLMVQIVTLFLFCAASRFPKYANYMKYLIYFLAFYGLGTVVSYLFGNGVTLENLYAAVSMPILEYTPLIGWLHGFVFGIFQNNTSAAILYGTLLLILMIICLLVIAFVKIDYYEDVLERAESYSEFQTAVREGTVSDKIMLGNKKIKLRKLGIQHGSGASTIFFKHLREGGRRSRFMFFNINTIVLILTAVISGMGVKLAFNEVMPTIIYIAAGIICCYVQFFFSAAGDWVKELNKPYIFLIPDNPVKKLIMAAATGLIKPFTDAFFAFGILAVFIGGNLSDIIISMLVYGSFGCVYIAANVLAQRIVGADSSGGIFITFYMSLIVLVLLPGVVMGIVLLGSMVNDYGWIAQTILGGPIFLWNIFISILIFMLCRNLLNNNE